MARFSHNMLISLKLRDQGLLSPPCPNCIPLDCSDFLIWEAFKTGCFMLTLWLKRRACSPCFQALQGNSIWQALSHDCQVLSEFCVTSLLPLALPDAKHVVCVLTKEGVSGGGTE